MVRFSTWLLPLALLLGAAGCSEEQSCTAGACVDARADRATLALDGLHLERILAGDRGGDRPAPAIEAQAPYQHEDITPATLQQWLAAKKPMTLVDVREPTEFAGGHIAGALNLAWTSGVLKSSLSQIPKSKPVVVYCATGKRSNSAATWLAEQGYQPVHDMLGGIAAWTSAGYPTEK